MRVLVVVGRSQLDPGRSSWLGALQEAADVTLWRRPDGSSPYKVLASAVAGLRAAVGAPGLAARALAARRIGRLKEAARSLLILADRADVLYFPRPEDAFGCVPAMTERPSVVSVPPGEGGRAPQGIARILSQATIVHHMFDVDRYELDALGVGARSMVARAGFDPRGVEVRGPSSMPPRPLRALIASAFWPTAGIEEALLATRFVVENGVEMRLDIVGAGPERERVIHTIHDLGLEHVVRVADPMPSHELVASIRDAHVLIDPHVLGALSWPALTALSMGVRVLAVDAGSAAEIIGHGDGAAVVAYGDAAALAGRLLEVASAPADGHLRDRMLELFDVNTQVTAFGAVVDSAAATRT